MNVIGNIVIGKYFIHITIKLKLPNFINNFCLVILKFKTIQLIGETTTTAQRLIGRVNIGKSKIKKILKIRWTKKSKKFPFNEYNFMITKNHFLSEMRVLDKEF